MKIAVTGSTGFIGRYVVRGLAREGHALRLLARPGREDAVPKPEGADLEVHTGDLTDRASLSGFLKGVDILIHLASAHDHFSDEVLQAVNVKGTEYLLDEASDNAPRHFQIFIVSSAVIGSPVYSYYRDTKRVQEKIIRGSGIEWASFRPTLVYGKGDQRHTGRLLRQYSKPKGTIWVPHEGISKINPVHVEDVVDAIIKFFDFDRGVDCVYELAGPAGIPYNEFVDLTIQAAGGGMKRRNIPKKWVDRGIFLLGLVKDVTHYRRAGAYFNLHHEHDIQNAVSELNWQPRTYAEGIMEVAQGDWWRNDDGED